jgi:HPt (histidine-containing phosphotransfer) domain-containing protein
MYPDKDAIEEKIKELEEIGDPDLVLELFRLYFEIIEERKSQMSLALKENKFDKIYFIAHSLKSTCGNLGSQILFQKLVLLEQKTKNNPEVSENSKIAELLNDVLAEIDKFSAFIAEKRQERL